MTQEPYNNCLSLRHAIFLAACNLFITSVIGVILWLVMK